MLRQLSYLSTESASIHRTRLSTNRGNGYMPPLSLNQPPATVNAIFPNFDCNNTGRGEFNNQPPLVSLANCFVVGNLPSEFGGGRAPNLFADP
jgi:hypothetical protein